ncbi:egalitarian protein homolog isoform X2 [Mytilus edulis]|uniref:egalitarian protein homolog isoform X2 n=1 Tax=Mytilus edulis TaxID=6550 RepID=UPI0039F130A3
MAAKYDRAGEQNNSTQDFILISRNEEAKALFQRIHRNKHNIATLGLDVESVELGSSVVCIVQIKVQDEPPYIIDIYGSNIDLKATLFNEIMKSEEIEKVIHDPRNDSRMLYETFQTEMRNVFDTQTFQMTVENQSNQALTTRRLQCQRKSLDFIYEKYVGRFPNQKLKDDMKSKMSEDQTIWLRRPLTREMALYAALDVETLLPIRVSMSKYLTNMDDDKRIAFLKTYNELCTESIYTPLPIANAEINLRKKLRECEEAKSLQMLGIVLNKKEKKLIRSF